MCSPCNMWWTSGRCRSDARLDGKTVVITGANTGIGKETVLDLVGRGARVVMACRDMEKAKAAAEDIREAHKGKDGVGTVEVVHLDLCSLASVRRCAKQLLEQEKNIDILINNAGIMACPRKVTEDGLEMQLGVNHMAHFLLTCLLLPRIRATGHARIITLSSLVHSRGVIHFDDLAGEKSYGASDRYCQSKLANVLFTKELAERLKAHNISDVTVYAVHPGVVATELSRHLDSGVFPGATFFWDRIMKLWIKTPEQGAQTTIHCAVDEDAGSETGLYYADCRPVTPGHRAQNADVARRLWEVSVQMTGLGDYDPFTAPNTTSITNL
ncbi:retinol dehydrogenase 11-like isoform X1 [Frankliniella occidentalis]|uniref:Retinol dehydrogenase 11-like isoform X1 n=2 Tax=Frankliniella occidentalis TaxID=133901 RepID=A0A9C6TQ16_FRAOC|nr:retinol dehydrogenase 11-like isoform X1 [Frankliniella occidentalis]